MESPGRTPAPYAGTNRIRFNGFVDERPAAGASTSQAQSGHPKVARSIADAAALVRRTVDEATRWALMHTFPMPDPMHA